MTIYDDRAAQLRQMNRASEADKDESYDEAIVRRSIVYTREDMAMVVSYLSSLNAQLRWLRGTIWIVIGMLALLVIRRG